ncbi:MAG TPA: A24 family peptidase [Burkholderiales bacterium]|nr:A24 family peptidase [Burkholderiales bacterium]
MLEMLASPGVLITLVVIVGLIIGSFLNVVIHRLPKMMEREFRAQCAELAGTPMASEPTFNLASPRSRCPQCNRPIPTLENIPVLSYLVLRGKCAQCGRPIALRYPLVEGLSAILSGYVAWRFGLTVAMAGALIFCWTLIVLTMIDIDTQLLPDSLTLPLIWLGLLLNLNGTFADLRSAVIGAVAGYLLLWSVYWCFKWATGKEGMGYGDFKLLAAIGAWLGWQLLPLTILLSSLVGAAVGITLIVVRRHGRDTPIPFGPYLAAAGLIALFWGRPIMQTYWQSS